MTSDHSQWPVKTSADALCRMNQRVGEQRGRALQQPRRDEVIGEPEQCMQCQREN